VTQSTDSRSERWEGVKIFIGVCRVRRDSHWKRDSATLSETKKSFYSQRIILNSQTTVTTIYYQDHRH